MAHSVHIDLRMNLRNALLAVSLLSLSVAAGCAASATSDDAASGGSAVTIGTQGPERSALITAVHARLDKDFAKATSLRGYSLVFDVHQLDSNATKAFFRGRLLKKDAAGKTHELTTADYAGTPYAEYIAEGLFDGPEVIAALTKTNGKWAIATHAIEGGDGGAADVDEAFAVGPTDVPWVGWDELYGLQTSWLGLGSANEGDAG